MDIAALILDPRAHIHPPDPSAERFRERSVLGGGKMTLISIPVITHVAEGLL